MSRRGRTAGTSIPTDGGTDVLRQETLDQSSPRTPIPVLNVFAFPTFCRADCPCTDFNDVRQYARRGDA